MTRHACYTEFMYVLPMHTQLPNQTPVKYFTPKIFTKDIHAQLHEFSDYSISIACTHGLQKDMSPTCSEAER